ncbi:hypothetical protein DV735_g452, partial [Chaetothyriales sp. CBS 134920]
MTTVSRQQAFQQLRPPCVALSSVALRFRGHQAPVKEVLYALQAVHRTLSQLGDQDALDEKLAQYAFFPLTHVFNEAQRLSSSCLEVAIQCVIVLVARGWRQHLSPDLAKQLLILMTLVSLPDAEAQSLEDVKAVALECIAAVLLQLSRRPDTQHLFADASTKSLLDQLVYIILEAISKSESERVQIAAAEALYHLLALVSNRRLLAAVLPNTASTLTKGLRKSVSARRTKKVLVPYLQVFNLLLSSVLADAVVKLSLVQVTRLRFHESADVRSALAELCLMVAQDCATSLSESRSIVVETLLYIGSREEGQSLSVSVLNLAISDSGIADIIRANFDRNCSSLPRVLAGHDEQPKGRILGELASSVALIQQIQSPRTDYLYTLTSSLLAISTDIKGSKVSGQEISILAEPLTGSYPSSGYSFPQLTLGPFYQKDVLSKLQLLLSACSSCGLAHQVARLFIDRVEGQPAEDQATAIWFALNCLRRESGRSDGDGDGNSLFLEDILTFEHNDSDGDGNSLSLEDILTFEHNDSDGDTANSRSQLISALYVSVLPFLQDEHGFDDDAVDARLKALAIECTVLQAEQLEVSYRPELVDSLYPILALLGSHNPMLRTHAIAGLNLLAQACGYLSASDMLVDNVDYLINAVALKLNSFDVSPQAPQVVLMMLRLCGARIVPYLDDTIASIFSALNNFHGYPRLVELLFQVLKAVVEESTQRPDLAIGLDHAVVSPKAPPIHQISDIVDDLHKRRSRKRRHVDDVEEELGQTPHPAHTIAALCTGAGSFMASRIDAVFPRQILAALVDLLVTILTTVQVSDDVGDQIVGMLAPFAAATTESKTQQPPPVPVQGQLPVRPALEAYNADALWLWEVQQNAIK